MTREVGVIPPNNFPVQYLGRGSDGRMPMYSQTDLNLHARVQAGRRQAAAARAERHQPVQPAHRDQPLRDDAQEQRRRDLVHESDFYQGKVDFDPLIAAIAKNPRFLMDNGFQAPLTARFGVRFLF